MSLPRMSWHIGDYKRDTGHLRTVEHGAYFLLIMHYWARGALPNDDGQLARIACLTDREWKAVRPTLAGLFQPGWRHGRVEDELAAAQTKYERLSAAGKKGGRPRNEKPSESQAFETLKPNESEAESDHKANAKQPITDNPKEEERKISPSARAVGSPTRTQTKTRIEGLFEELWAKKPRRDGANPKMPALKKFLRLLPFGEDGREATAREIINACGRWADAERKSGREGKETVAQLITWLNQSRWGDYPAPQSAATAPVGFYAADDSPELDAWDAHYRSTKGINAPRDHAFGWRFPTQWPPGHEVKNGMGTQHGTQGTAPGIGGAFRGTSGAQAEAAGVSGREAEPEPPITGRGGTRGGAHDDGRAAAPAGPARGFTIE